MAELKTKKTAASVIDFLNLIEHGVKRRDSFAILELMRDVTGEEPAMEGASIVGSTPITTIMPPAARASGCWRASRRENAI